MQKIEKFSNKPKNRPICPLIGRGKQQFASEEEANRFIKWNAPNIFHGDTLRAYYCEACCCWHVTHQLERGQDKKAEELLETVIDTGTRRRWTTKDNKPINKKQFNSGLFIIDKMKDFDISIFDKPTKAEFIELLDKEFDKYQILYDLEDQEAAQVKNTLKKVYSYVHTFGYSVPDAFRVAFVMKYKI